MVFPPVEGLTCKVFVPIESAIHTDPMIMLVMGTANLALRFITPRAHDQFVFVTHDSLDFRSDWMLFSVLIMRSNRVIIGPILEDFMLRPAESQFRHNM